MCMGAGTQPQPDAISSKIRKLLSPSNLIQIVDSLENSIASTSDLEACFSVAIQSFDQTVFFV